MTVAAHEAPATSRLASIDIFRGLTMVVMIFVNDIEGVRGLPWWTHHAKANVDVMTYVDMVFPFFLFIIGLSMPIAIQQRLKRDPSLLHLCFHVLIRSGSLIVLGLILANAEAGSAALMGLNPNAWTLLALLGASLFLSVYDGKELSTRAHLWLRMVGLGLVVVMFLIFRRMTSDGHMAWIDGSYPEILGLLGFTYLAVAILYIPTRRWLFAPLAWFAVLVTFSALCTSKWLLFPRHLPLCVWPFGDGTMAFITMAGIVASTIFVGSRRWQTLRNKLLIGTAFGISTLAMGRLLTPLGISKIRDTPTWGLYSVGAAVLLFTALHWICDAKKKTTWAFFARPAGANTLLTYLLPDFYYFVAWLAGFTYFENHFNYGWPGAIRAAVFTAIILTIAGIFTRMKIRLQL